MAKYRKLGRTSNQRKALLRNQVTQLLYHGKIRTTEAKAKEIRKIAEGLIALGVKEKDNFEVVKVQAKVAKKDAEGKRVKEVVDGKKVTVYETVEKEIKKGSAPVAFAGLGFSEECYHLVDSQAKMNQLLDYFFRNEEYAALAERQVKSNIYAEMGKRLNFRSARSNRDRKNMEVAAKRWIKKKHPTFDGDVYVENIRCFLDISREELEKRKCTVNEQDITALIFSQKHLEALYLQ